MLVRLALFTLLQDITSSATYVSVIPHSLE
jgi:hypothetical protein